MGGFVAGSDVRIQTQSRQRTLINRHDFWGKRLPGRVHNTIGLNCAPHLITVKLFGNRNTSSAQAPARRVP